MSNILPVITLYQPWATEVALQWKEIETRLHQRFACLKGRDILIHAGLKGDYGSLPNPYLTQQQNEYLSQNLIKGHIICKTHVNDFGLLWGGHSKRALIDCAETIRFGLFLKNTIEIEPIPEKGEMGIWYYDLDAKKKVKKPKPQQIFFI